MSDNRLAYWDTFSGLLPCRAIGFDHEALTIELTVDRGPYKRGELHTVSVLHVWPRDCAWPKRGSFGLIWIVLGYNWRNRVG